ncbi:neuropeptides B/W receptor type 2-like [Haliotis asinina]|uniref:neuropeptides B/W receptor type 2-like n=1 Tax=Haliotis asinina TaxID=109174 RepID=UPI0035323461
MEAPKRDGPISSADLIFILVMSVICSVTIGANVVVICTISFTRKMHCLSSALVMNMAACDLGIGLASMPLVLAGLVNGYWPYSQVACHVTAALTNVLCISSVWSVIAIALDRIISVARRHARRIGDVTTHADGSRGHVSTTGAVAAGAMFSVRRLSMLSFPGNVKNDFNSCYDNDFNSNSSVTSRRNLLVVPKQSFDDNSDFLLPNAVSSDDIDSKRAEDASGEQEVYKRSSVCTIADYVYDKQNTANIEIKLELVI